ncbi:Pho2p KNAG_0A05600 [Huiozyma naganishii CBS 8797]|uniref:Homeobox domain-containing protein n=1 Tax=Huiozyma naganishii (strain ATCC MYA-139 / BCRC 22969 / CBS 8797 / KCTC 17520 / NBRC 10181 / NCYC 3082 / Yp74L-3) TaxID=1071383 RepID=J7S2K5_HUIN7|nr:hypothetical protein KNAG_0A05600 [Kazachstania naganishii CBS 8797]CCK68224.1 hypothetical protein KNAG_0A05600 [Kazachstania naganishii CBS 8797]
MDDFGHSQNLNGIFPDNFGLLPNEVFSPEESGQLNNGGALNSNENEDGHGSYDGMARGDRDAHDREHGHDSQDETSHARAKRKRAKGETLDILEKEFETNPSPSIDQRKVIAKMIDMPMKNVTIWFQNRRAKFKKNRMKNLANRQEGTSSIHGGNSYLDLNFFDRIPLNINKNYYFIDICSITVGAWNRMKSGSLLKMKFPLLQMLKNLSPQSINSIMLNSTDLLVLISKKNFEINYFFSAMANSTKILFRIFYPIDAVTNCSLSLESDDAIIRYNRDTGKPMKTSGRDNEDSDDDGTLNDENSNAFGELKLTVDKPPNFAVYFLNESGADNNTANLWSICEDFSEGKQVSDAFVGGSNVPHTLKGLQGSLRFMNSLILDYKSTNHIIAPPPQQTDIMSGLTPLTEMVTDKNGLGIPMAMSLPITDQIPLTESILQEQHDQQNNILYNNQMTHLDPARRTPSSTLYSPLNNNDNPHNHGNNNNHNHHPNSQADPQPLPGRDFIGTNTNINNNSSNDNTGTSNGEININNNANLRISLGQTELDSLNLGANQFFFDSTDLLNSSDNILSALHDIQQTPGDQNNRNNNEENFESGYTADNVTGNNAGNDSPSANVGNASDLNVSFFHH